MNAKDAVREVMKRREVSLTKLASLLEIKDSVLADRLHRPARAGYRSPQGR